MALYIPSSSLREKLISKIHGGGLAGHMGHARTHAMLRGLFYWSTMRRDANAFIRRCYTCQTVKGQHTNADLCTSLPIPKRPWQNVSMDFIVGLPCTSRSHDFFLVVVNRFSKMSHFIPCSRTIDASHVALLYFWEIVRLHGDACKITSDRNMRFTGHF